MGSWQVEKTLYKHTAGITAMALHPTGKLAFTAGDYMEFGKSEAGFYN